MKKELLIASALVGSVGLAGVAEAASMSFSGNHRVGVAGSDSNATAAAVKASSIQSSLAVSVSETTDAGIKISMDGKGRATDNIMIERFWRSAKYESIYLNQYKNIRELQDGIDDYVSFYNYDRIHQSLDYKTPMEVYENDVLGNKIEGMIAA